VTGGQRGLGKALTGAFMQRGAAGVYATARIPAPAPIPWIVSLALE
jgi:NAD(P)-dependent dehydrogenase (short-subunit alcohol dehydrogenase family)